MGDFLAFRDILIKSNSGKCLILAAINSNDVNDLRTQHIENDVKRRTIEIDEAKISVDTQEDLDEIREFFKKDTIKFEYL